MNKANQATKTENSKSFLLSLLSVVILTYSGVLELFTIALSVKYKWVTEVLNDYMTNESFSETKVLMLSLTGMVIFGITFWSALLIWKLKKSGFVIYVSITIITIFVLKLSGYGYMPEYITLIGIMIFMFFYMIRTKKRADLSDNEVQDNNNNN
ncbi:MAG: hypothetical protein B6D61_03160 [Bacteroidetes bacterium 4484_249]|nr:MAG: hypothetical protein B6D61_03160 [Bacteroidetes bacterium 4484_249]